MTLLNKLEENTQIQLYIASTYPHYNVVQANIDKTHSSYYIINMSINDGSTKVIQLNMEAFHRWSDTTMIALITKSHDKETSISETLYEDLPLSDESFPGKE
jgi:hypothetical protein